METPRQAKSPQHGKERHFMSESKDQVTMEGTAMLNEDS